MIPHESAVVRLLMLQTRLMCLISAKAFLWVLSILSALRSLPLIAQLEDPGVLMMCRHLHVSLSTSWLRKLRASTGHKGNAEYNKWAPEFQEMATLVVCARGPTIAGIILRSMFPKVFGSLLNSYVGK